MTPTPNTRTVTLERDYPHPPEKLWRALTQPHLIAEWLMENDFAPTPGHHFTLRAAWGSVTCEVLEADPPNTLAYTWAAMGLQSVVTYTLTKTPTGTRLRMEQTGFQPHQDQAFQGATQGWQHFLAKLEATLAKSA